MNRLIGLLLLLAGLAYPFAVYYGLQHFSPAVFALLLGTLWLARALSPGARPYQRWLAVPILAFCLSLAVVNETELLRWYPVLINLTLLGIFGCSLIRGTPLIERLAQLREPDLPQHAVRYTRRVTEVWTLFFLFNLTATCALALWAPLSWWALYTGLVAYVLMGLLFAGEWLVRKRVRSQA